VGVRRAPSPSHALHGPLPLPEGEGLFFGLSWLFRGDFLGACFWRLSCGGQVGNGWCALGQRDRTQIGKGSFTQPGTVPWLVMIYFLSVGGVMGRFGRAGAVPRCEVWVVPGSGWKFPGAGCNGLWLVRVIEYQA
jgi:hypothetical protein